MGGRPRALHASPDGDSGFVTRTFFCFLLTIEAICNLFVVFSAILVLLFQFWLRYRNTWNHFYPPLLRTGSPIWANSKSFTRQEKFERCLRFCFSLILIFLEPYLDCIYRGPRTNYLLLSMCDKWSMRKLKNAKMHYHNFSQKNALYCDLCKKSWFG